VVGLSGCCNLRCGDGGERAMIGDRATMRSAAMEVKNTAGDALRQAFMAREDYEGLREEERVWARLQKPLGMVGVTVVWTAVVAAMMVMVDVVFAVSGDDFPFCQKRRLPFYDAPGHRAGLPSYLYTEEEAVDAFWLVVFLPSSIVFVFSTIYLFAGKFFPLNPNPQNPPNFAEFRIFAFSHHNPHLCFSTPPKINHKMRCHSMRISCHSMRISCHSM
jgi:hypothetical protein